MALHLPTFFTRLASAIVFAVVMLVGLLWNNWAFLILVSIINSLCLFEFFKMMKKIYSDSEWPKWLPTATLIFSLVLILLPPILVELIGSPTITAQQQFVPPLLVGVTLLLLATTLSKKTALRAGLVSLVGIAYITMPIIMLYGLRLQSLLLPVALIILIWTNDTLAYLVGSFIGKTPFSTISPKKTWEGTIGGALICVGLALSWGHYSKLFNLIDWAFIALFAAVVGTLGDLLESKLKRLAGVKDSGNLMPGHGGALDRFDSLLIATPFTFAYAYIFMEALPIKVF